ncbi:hypothetical protein F7734_59315 [Scytonema sp. UIC 10036]|uniref:hypothetical protein n=1 Tax=Scytonema sp. UIC 10036 TaxID=2304196 RepID=UPI0012DA565A|nr:hypothetical protein [Scytonema sp. UIC 10036]MUH01686.1 hypothetical protein [Scytonema sp. UIC 10036]
MPDWEAPPPVSPRSRQGALIRPSGGVPMVVKGVRREVQAVPGLSQTPKALETATSI